MEKRNWLRFQYLIYRLFTGRCDVIGTLSDKIVEAARAKDTAEDPPKDSSVVIGLSKFGIIFLRLPSFFAVKSDIQYQDEDDLIIVNHLGRF